MANFEEVIQGITHSESMTKVDRLKVAVCGDFKAGKSCLVARTARKPLLHYDFDDRRESIAGLSGVSIKTIVDKGTDDPKAWGVLDTDIGGLEYLKSQGKLDLKSICLDSMSFLHVYAQNQMMKETKLERVQQIGNIKYHIPQGWDAVNYVQRMFPQVLRRLFALDIDVYCIFHTRQERDKVRSTKENSVYTDKLTIEPQNLYPLLSMFNEVWRCYILDGAYKVQTKADYYFNAATALSIDNVEEASIEKMLLKHEKNINKK